MLFSLALLAACLSPMDDNSIGLGSIQDAPDVDDHIEVQGDLLVTAGDGEGDHLFEIGDTRFAYHSPGRLDLTGLSGPATVRLSLGADGGLVSLLVRDADGAPAFSVSNLAEETGDDAFGRDTWALGAAIGRGERRNAYDEPLRVEYREVEVETDGGPVRLLPGEPSTLTLDGVRFQVTVLAAYETIEPGGDKCDIPDVLAVELLRGEADESLILALDPVAAVPSGECG